MSQKKICSMIDETTFRRACTNMSRASPQTVELFGCLIQNIIYPIGSPEHEAALARIFEYVASDEFLAEEGL